MNEKFVRSIWTIFTSFFLFSCCECEASCSGRVDLGPAYIHVDVLESGHTIKRMDMLGFRADSTLVVYKGFCLKPSFLYGNGKGNLWNAGLGFGHFVPINDQLCITPVVGFAYTYMETKLDIPIVTPFFATILRERERFRSRAPYLGLDVHYKFLKKWRMTLSVQYAWSRTRTKIEKIGNFRSKSKGPSYAAMLERDITDHWSVNIGVAYNISLSREKHGLRAAGGRLGVSRWF